MLNLTKLRRLLPVAPLLLLLAAVALAQSGPKPKVHKMVVIPGEDRFTPLALTIHAGDSVQWVNMDTDDHTVVSDDAFNTAGHQGFDQLLPGTDSNGGQPGTLMLTFPHRGTFVYFCRFHSHLDGDNQPAAPGPRGGIQDPGTACEPAAADSCNFGTPMMGVITVLGHRDHEED
jgi:plastocyanin